MGTCHDADAFLGSPRRKEGETGKAFRLVRLLNPIPALKPTLWGCPAGFKLAGCYTDCYTVVGFHRVVTRLPPGRHVATPEKQAGFHLPAKKPL